MKYGLRIENPGITLSNPLQYNFTKSVFMVDSYCAFAS